MPRKKIVRGERVAEVIQKSDRPFATTSDIAEGLDVTAQAVRDNANDLAEHPKIEKGMVAQSSVYWLSKNDVPEGATLDQPDRGSKSSPDAKQKTEEGEKEASLLGRINLSGKAVPGVLLLLGLGWLAGWNLYKAALLSWRQKDRIVGENGLLDISAGSFEVDYGLIGLFVSAVMAFLSAGLIGVMLFQAVTNAQTGFWGAALGYLIGVAAVVALLYQFGHRKAESMTRKEIHQEDAA